MYVETLKLLIFGPKPWPYNEGAVSRGSSQGGASVGLDLHVYILLPGIKSVIYILQYER